MEGAANRELVALLADHLGVRPADVTIRTGALGREKRVHVRGLSEARVRGLLGPLLYVDKAPGRA